jgi:transcriptional regulator with XRE-family HTH domain
MSIAQEIRALRACRTQTQDQFAREVGVTRQQVVLWESGKSSPSIANLQALVGLGLSPEFLMGSVPPERFTTTPPRQEGAA